MATLSYAGQFNGYLPRETGQVVAFVRGKDKFKLFQYVQLVKSEASLGTYVVLERDQFIRLPSGDMMAWEDGDERPRGVANRLRHKIEDFRTLRRDFPWTIGYKTLSQTKSFQLRPAHMAMAISQAMTDLTKRVWDVLQTAGTWGDNTKTANTLNGGRGNWANASDDPDSPNYNAIFLSLVNAAQEINLATNGEVQPGDLCVIVSPNAAISMAASAEITNYCRESPVARQILENGLDPQYSLWGLPTRYKGFKFLVEDAPIVTEYPKLDGTEATTNRTRIKDDTSAVILSRPGALDGEYGAPSFSTVQVYHNDAITQVEAFDEPKHRRVDGHVVTDAAIEVPAAIAGYRITSIQ